MSTTMFKTEGVCVAKRDLETLVGVVHDSSTPYIFDGTLGLKAEVYDVRGVSTGGRVKIIPERSWLLLKYDGIIVGSPCYMANVTGKIKEFLDATWSLRGKLDGKVGAAFGAARHLAGGVEETLRSIHNALLLHGMVIQGSVSGGPFGATALDPTGKREDVLAEEGEEARTLGQRTAALVKKLAEGL